MEGFAKYRPMVLGYFARSLRTCLCQQDRRVSRSAALMWVPVHAAAVMLTGRGDGHGVLVVPGLGANDVSTVSLRTYLRSWAMTYTPSASARLPARGGKFEQRYNQLMIEAMLATTEQGGGIRRMLKPG